MQTLKLKNRKIIKQGESHFIYIPKAYFNNGQLDPHLIYDIIIQIPPEPEIVNNPPTKAEVE